MQCLGQACERFCSPAPALPPALGDRKPEAGPVPEPPLHPAEVGFVPPREPVKLVDIVEDNWADGRDPAPEPARDAVDTRRAPQVSMDAICPEPAGAPRVPDAAVAAATLSSSPPEGAAVAVAPPAALATIPCNEPAVDPVAVPGAQEAPTSAVSTPSKGATVSAPQVAAEPAMVVPEPTVATEPSTEQPPAEQPLDNATPTNNHHMLPAEDMTSPTSQQQSTTAAAPPHEEERRDEVTFFNGSWSGTRNDWTGDVGISFVIRASCRITALGRHVDSALAESATVTLWLADTHEVVATADIGPGSKVEGNYAFEPLSTEVEARVGVEYRLTQRCRGRMPDKWFDGSATADEVFATTALHCAKFVGGVCRNDYGYPGREDGEFRRAGMVNFKVAQLSLKVVSVTRAELAKHIAGAVAAESSRDRDYASTYLSVVASLLALLADELAFLPGAAATVVVAEEATIRKCLLRLEEAGAPAAKAPEEVPASGEPSAEAEEAGEQRQSVLDQGFAERLVATARRRRREDPPCGSMGVPLEDAFVVSPRGHVLAAEARLLRGDRPVSGEELVAMLGAGMVLSRSTTGSVTTLLAPDLGEGSVFLLDSSSSGQRPDGGADPAVLSKV